MNPEVELVSFFVISGGGEGSKPQIGEGRKTHRENPLMTEPGKRPPMVAVTGLPEGPGGPVVMGDGPSACPPTFWVAASAGFHSLTDVA